MRWTRGRTRRIAVALALVCLLLILLAIDWLGPGDICRGDPECERYLWTPYENPLMRRGNI